MLPEQAKPWVSFAQFWKAQRNLDRTPDAYSDTMKRLKGCREMIDFYVKREKETSQ